jgi:hypothetical protein
MSITLTEHRAQVFYDVLTSLSRIHAHGVKHPFESAIASDTGYLQRDVHTMLLDAEAEEWVRLVDPKLLTWRLRDGIVAAVPEIKYCDVCRLYKGGIEVRAIADARLTGGRWGFVCVEHFVEHAGQLGLGRGQFLRLDY